MVIPTVKFDAGRVTDAIRADLWERILEFEDLPLGEEKNVFEAAVQSVSLGRNLGLLTQVLVEMGVSRSRAAYIATYLNNRATSLMAVAHSRSLGINEAKWMYSGAPCYGTKNPSAAELAVDTSHRSADRKTFSLDKGMMLNGMWTFPGLEAGCKCVMISIVPGFN